MSDRPASWRMPTPKQMEKLRRQARRKPDLIGNPGPADDMPEEYWSAVLQDAEPDARQTGKPARQRRLSEMPQPVLRVSCDRCRRIVEIQKADAVRLYGPDAIWKDVRQRLLDDTCSVRTGRYEEDGCWPSFEC